MIYFKEKEQAILIIGVILLIVYIFLKLRTNYYRKLKICPKCGHKLILKEELGFMHTYKHKYCFKCNWSKELH